VFRLLPAGLLSAALAVGVSSPSATLAARPEPVTLGKPNPAIVVTPARPVVVAPPAKKVVTPRPKRVTRVRKAAASTPSKPVVRKPVVSHPVVKKAPQPPLTFAARLAAAVARIPGYKPGSATWEVTSKYGNWGAADWKYRIIYISPTIPTDRIYDVAVHEWSHILSLMPYASNTEAKAAMNRVFGGSGLTGAERAADCMALRLGATWTNYTDCTNAAWKAAAAKLIAGQAI
jgi:hypothetical protein